MSLERQQNYLVKEKEVQGNPGRTFTILMENKVQLNCQQANKKLPSTPNKTFHSYLCHSYTWLDVSKPNLRITYR